MLTRYDLGGFLGAKPSELSGGMRQRAALIRTLIMEPTLLLLDEPFSALDYQTRLTVCNDICEIIRTNKKTAILVTHDLAEAVSTGNRVLVLGKRHQQLKWSSYLILILLHSHHSPAGTIHYSIHIFKSFGRHLPMKNEELMRLLARRPKKKPQAFNCRTVSDWDFVFCHLGVLRPIWHYK